ncbi:MAG: LptA/OstA family protein [bacterium]
MLKYILIFFFCIIIISNVIIAEEHQETIRLDVGIFKSHNNKVTLNDGVEMTKGETIIKSNEGEMDTEKRTAIFKNNVILENSDIEIFSLIMEAWFEDDKYVFSEEVKFSYNIKEGQEENSKMILETSFLELNSKTNAFSAKNGVTIQYESKTIAADFVEYNDEKQELYFKDNVKIIEKNGDIIRSSGAILNVENDKFIAEENVQIEFKI